MNYELKEFDFYISFHCGLKFAKGYAIKVDLPYRWVLHHSTGYGWSVSHFDTGWRILGGFESQYEALQYSFQVIKQTVKNGLLKRQLHKINWLYE